MNKPSALNIIAITVAHPGKEQLLKGVQTELVKETVKEDGCLRYELHQSLDDGRTLIFVETWASEEAWNAHMQGEAIKNFRLNGGEFIQDIQMYKLGLVADGK